MAIITGLISSLINITLSQDIPICQLQQLQCLHHGSTQAYLCSPLCSIPFSTAMYTVGDNLRYAHYGFGVRLAVLADVLLMLFFYLERHPKCSK